MGAGDVCSLCLDPFEDKAVAAVATRDANDARAALRSAEPPIVALRCGHCLHIECAEPAVRAAESRHVRCPLCREPVSLTGAVAARCFG
jgi:hypothetical protein